MSVGLQWYKREPVAYLGDVQGLTAKEHAVYAIVIDLLYVHGGSINNDPAWIAGWIRDMGSASVRNSLMSLESNPKITICITKDEITQKRAKNETKTKRKQSENAVKTGRKGGKKSAELRGQNNKINNLAEPSRVEESRVEESRVDAASTTEFEILTDREIILIAMGHDQTGITATGRIVGNQNDMLILSKWQGDLKLSIPEIETVIIEITKRRNGRPPPFSFNFYNEPMQVFAGNKLSPKLEPIEGQSNENYRSNKGKNGAGMAKRATLDEIADRGIRWAVSRQKGS